MELKSNMITSMCARAPMENKTGLTMEKVQRPQGRERQAWLTGQGLRQTKKENIKTLMGGWRMGLVFLSAVLFPSTELLNNWMKGVL